MTKEEIIHFIQQSANENSGVPLGKKLFHDKFPVKISDWYGKIWTKWSDAIQEAGYTPKKFVTQAEPIEILLESISKIIKQKNKFPTFSELRFIHNNDKMIPSTQVIRKRLGNKSQIAKAVSTYCSDKPDYSVVKNICDKIVDEESKKESKSVSPKSNDNQETLGCVYLMKSGKYYKIGKANHVGMRNYSIGIKLPEKLEIIHEIATDDPFGIEKYWHNRFSDKRLDGEWFDLTAKEVNAFKRRKKFM